MCFATLQHYRSFSLCYSLFPLVIQLTRNWQFQTVINVVNQIIAVHSILKTHYFDFFLQVQRDEKTNEATNGGIKS